VVAVAMALELPVAQGVPPELQSECEDPFLGEPPSGGPGQDFLPLRRTYAVLGLLGLIAVGAVLMRPGATAAAEPVAAEDVVGLAEMVVKPAFEKCSVRAENCVASRCCVVSGLAGFREVLRESGELRGLEVLRGVRLGMLPEGRGLRQVHEGVPGGRGRQLPSACAPHRVGGQCPEGAWGPLMLSPWHSNCLLCRACRSSCRARSRGGDPAVYEHFAHVQVHGYRKGQSRGHNTQLGGSQYATQRGDRGVRFAKAGRPRRTSFAPARVASYLLRESTGLPSNILCKLYKLCTKC